MMVTDMLMTYMDGIFTITTMNQQIVFLMAHSVQGL